MLSATSVQLSALSPSVRGLRCVMARMDMRNDISSITPRMIPTKHNKMSQSVTYARGNVYKANRLTTEVDLKQDELHQRAWILPDDGECDADGTSSHQSKVEPGPDIVQ